MTNSSDGGFQERAMRRSSLPGAGAPAVIDRPIMMFGSGHNESRRPHGDLERILPGRAIAILHRRVFRSGAPRSTKVGTIRSLSRYDEGLFTSTRLPILR